MLEIIVLINIGKQVAQIASNKGRKPISYVCLLVAFWFGFEFLGGIIFGIAYILVTHKEEPPTYILYVPALLSAVLGAVLAFRITKSKTALPGSIDAQNGV
jgi:hypothetical protein